MNTQLQMWIRYFEYLDGLRKSGVTNMFGAAPYVSGRFGTTKQEARTILAKWMETFGDGTKPAAERAAKIEES